jgi:ribulose-bisphosphate carboxylase large chain
MVYIEYVDESYNPKDSDLIALFRVEPAKGISFSEAAGRVASESSNGTWTDVALMKEHIRELSAKAYYLKKPWIKVAYPKELFEEGNMSQILSSIAGNIFGMKAIKYLRLEDVYWPKEIVTSFPGPQHGIDGVRKILEIYDRPITATVPKPKVGLYTEEYVDAAREIWLGGIDLVKDDENLTSQSFNKFRDRVENMFRLRDKIEKETGERKGYLINITAPYNEMIKRAKLVYDHGGEFIMIDILTTGWSSLQSIREELVDLRLAIHAHRAFHAAFTRFRLHGMSMKVVAEISRLLGVDHIHIGTIVGKLESPLRDVIPLIRICRDKYTREYKKYKLLKKIWNGIKPIFPVSSGGLHPGLIPFIIKVFGRDVIIQAGGGVIGHPEGPMKGAEALREAIDAAISGEELEERANRNKALRIALEYWGRKTPI